MLFPLLCTVKTNERIMTKTKTHNQLVQVGINIKVFWEASQRLVLTVLEVKNLFCMYVYSKKLCLYHLIYCDYI